MTVTDHPTHLPDPLQSQRVRSFLESAMYLPTAFAEHDTATLLAFMRAHPFATLVTHDGDGSHAGHVPLLVSHTDDGQVELRGHLAKANPQSAHHGAALVIFHGPHVYISADWYEADNVVPTWNYQVVHAHGAMSTSNDPGAITAVLDDLGKNFEPVWPARWHQRLTPAVHQSLSRQITAVTVKVTQVTGKWKLGQHQTIERRRRTVTALRHLGGEDRLAVAAAMEHSVTTETDHRT